MLYIKKSTFSRSWARRLPLPVLFFCCLAWESVCLGAVPVKLKNGNVMKFDAVEAKAGRLECRLPEGTIFLTVDQLSAEEVARYFPDRLASTPPARTIPVSAPAPAVSTPASSPDPAPYRQPPAETAVAASKQQGGFFYTFNKPPAIQKKNPDVDYNHNIRNEKFYIYVPKTYDGSKPFGLVAFIGSKDAVEIPWGWDAILRERGLLFVAPQNVGDNDAEGRRVGLTMLGILKMMEEYKIDPSRVYVAGQGDGGRMAARLAFQHPEVIRGCIACSGVEYFKPVKWGGTGYGVWSHSAPLVAAAKRNVRFAVVAGETDPRREEVLDLYYGGFVKDGFQTKLFDVPSSPQGTFSANVLSHSLEFLEANRK